MATIAIASVSAAHAQPYVAIEAPAGGVVSQPFAISGWAVEPAATASSGIDLIAVYTGTPAAPIFLGHASAEARPDVAAHFQRPGWANSGFRFTVSGLAPGTHQFGLMVHSTLTNLWSGPYQTTAIVPSAPIATIDPVVTSVQPFVLKGLAGDALATSNPGISMVQVWVDRVGGPTTYVGMAQIGVYRPDALVYGAQYAYSGWQITLTGLPPGQYSARVRATSSITGLVGETATPPGPITNDPRMAVESPPNGGLLMQPFSVSGAALDFAAVAGSTGADLMRLSARSVTTGATVVLGTTSPNLPRPDLQALLGNNPQFLNIGFRFDNLSGLAPGDYDLITEMRSAVSQQWTALVTRVRLDLRVAAPVVSPPSGEYSAPVTVSVASATPGAVIRYTTDGQEPTEASPIAPAGSTVISSAVSAKLKAFVPGYFPSPTIDLSYAFRAAPPVLTPGPGTYEGPLSLTIATATPGATVHYTLDGSDPVETSPEFSGTVDLVTSVNPRFKAFRAGWLSSPTVGGLYTILPASPRFSVASGTYDNPQTVAMSTPTPNASIRYTTDGTDPTLTSTLYSSPVLVATATTLKARTFDGTGTASSVSSLTLAYAIGTPTLAPPPGSYSAAPINVTVTSSTLNATIRYTLDGSNPGPGSPAVPSGSTVQIFGSATLRVQAVVPGWSPSPVVAGFYELKAVEPMVVPQSGTYARPFSVSVTHDPLTFVRYTTDGSVPTATSLVWTGFANPGNGIYNFTFRAFATGWTPSDPVARQYEIVDVVAQTPVITPPPGDHAIGVTVTVSSAEPGVTLRVTTDGTDPTASSPIYAGPIGLNTPTTVKARAFRTGAAPSNIAGGLYRLKLARPTITPPAGLYASAPQPVVTHPTSGVTLRYTLDRNEPTDTSPVVPAGCCIPIANDTSLKVRAFLSGWAPSDSTTNTYFVGSVTPPISAATLVFTPPDESAAPVGQPLSITVGTVPLVVSTVRVTRNGVDVTNQATVGSSAISVPNFVVAGRNRVAVTGVDATGASVWAEIDIHGTTTQFAVTVRATDNSLLSGATATLSVSGSSFPPQSLLTNLSGMATFLVPPGFAGSLSVQVAGYHAAVLPTVSGTATTVILSPINENFERGLNEWVLSYPQETSLRAHIEGIAPWFCRLNCSGPLFSADTSDQDMIVGTWFNAAGATAVRQYKLEPGSRVARVRFRFFSHTLAGWYRLALSVPGTVQQPVIVSETMQNLQQRGLATPGTQNLQSYWVGVSINVPVNATELRVEVTLPPDSNPGFSATWFEIDRIVTDGVLLVQPELYDEHPATSTLKERLEFLSLGPRDGSSGITRVWGRLSFAGTTSLTGAPPPRISAVFLDIFDRQTSVLRRSIPLRADVGTLIYNRQFTSGGIDTGPTSRELFTFTDADMQAFARTGEEPLVVRVRALDDFSAPINVLGTNIFSVQKLVDADPGVARYGTRDTNNCIVPANGPVWPCLGDGWGRPVVHRIIERARQTLSSPPQGVPAEAMTINDISNMNGGYFPIHTTHRNGDAVDALIPGYEDRDASVAVRMVRVAQALHAAAVAEGVTLSRILVSYSANGSFATELAKPIHQVGGRPASDFIRRDSSSVHADHFHFEINVP